MNKEVLEVSYSTVESGTGFGLSIVEEIVEGHGWSIQVTGERTAAHDLR